MPGAGVADVAWLNESGEAMTVAQWEEPQTRRVAMVLGSADAASRRFAVMINGDREAVTFSLPQSDGYRWDRIGGGSQGWNIGGRSVAFAFERPLA